MPRGIDALHISSHAAKRMRQRGITRHHLELAWDATDISFTNEYRGYETMIRGATVDGQRLRLVVERCAPVLVTAYWLTPTSPAIHR